MPNMQILSLLTRRYRTIAFTVACLAISVTQVWREVLAKQHKLSKSQSFSKAIAKDAEIADKLRKANPQAFRNILGRMLEAHGRGFWQSKTF